MNTLTYSLAPHVKSPRTTRGIMIDVCIALLPACIVGCIFFGFGAVLMLVVSVLFAVASEVVYKLCAKVPFEQILNEFDFSSVVTGLLIGMNMYATSKWYAAALASVFAVVVVKMLFGGTGKNIVNPAIAGRIFAFISFGAAFGGTMAQETKYLSQISPSHFIEAGATPLAHIYGEATSSLGYLDLLLGTGVSGTVGEVCKLALILGGVYLVVRQVLNFRWPVVYIGSTFIVTALLAFFSAMSEYKLGTPQWSAFAGDNFVAALGTGLEGILTGGLMLGAIFMATDYVTTPNTKLGNYIYFALLGILTAVLRKMVGGEVVSFVILLGNIIVPLIDTYIVRKPFGKMKEKEAN